MQGKRIFPGALAVLLLISFFWGGVCDAACLIREAQPECHVSQASSAMQTRHSHCAHLGRAAGSKNTSAVFMDAASGCGHTFCRQPASSLIPAKNISLGDVQWATISFFPVPEQGFISEQFANEASPPVHPVSPSLLPIALRI